MFLKDTVTGAVELVNVDSDEQQLGGYCGSIGMGMSSDARYIVFESDAYRSLPYQYVGSDVFVRDRVAGTTTNLTAASNARNGNTQITPDGRFVLFGSEASNLAPGTDACGVRWRQYVYDRQTQAIDLVSVDSNGADPCGGNGSNIGAISADGRFVAFYTDAVLGPDGFSGGVYVRDRLLGQTALVSRDENGTPINGYVPAISADGRFVAFPSYSYPRNDVYVVDRSTGTSERVNVDDNGTVLDNGEYPSISAGGRFVTFSALAYRLPGHYGAAAYDLWVRDRVTGTSSRVVNGAKLPGGGSSFSSFLTADGHFLAFQSTGSSWVAGDTNGVEDVFVHERTGPLDAAAPPNPDIDGDGVANAIDVGDGAFDDGAGTTGSIVQPVPAAPDGAGGGPAGARRGAHHGVRLGAGEGVVQRVRLPGDAEAGGRERARPRLRQRHPGAGAGGGRAGAVRRHDGRVGAAGWQGRGVCTRGRRGVGGEPRHDPGHGDDGRQQLDGAAGPERAGSDPRRRVRADAPVRAGLGGLSGPLDEGQGEGRQAGRPGLQGRRGDHARDEAEQEGGRVEGVQQGRRQARRGRLADDGPGHDPEGARRQPLTRSRKTAPLVTTAGAVD